jgi:hypothetical protein
MMTTLTKSRPAAIITSMSINNAPPPTRAECLELLKSHGWVVHGAVPDMVGGVKVTVRDKRGCKVSHIAETVTECLHELAAAASEAGGLS